MSLPASYTRIMALLRRLSPSFPKTDDDTDVGKELSAIAAALGTATDPLDGALDEVFPDTTLQIIDRWEKVTRVATRTSDDIETRRARVLSVLRRTSGPRVDQLRSMLAAVLDCTVDDLIFVEALRSEVDDMLTETTGVVDIALPTTAPGLQIPLGKPWPGLVDGDSSSPLLLGSGVSVYLAFNSATVDSVTLKSPKGTSWTVPVTSTAAWYNNRTLFTGETAGGRWTLSAYSSAAPHLNEFRLRVSNNVDSGQIYNFFCHRDPALGGTPDLVEAQRLFHRTALAEMRAFVVETLNFKTDDPYSLTDRDPLGV